MALRIEWHPEAVADLARLGTSDLRRIKGAISELSTLDDARQRLIPYAGTMKGFWKLRVGDYRLVCRVEDRRGQVVLVIFVAHRSRAYDQRGARVIASRTRE